MKNKKGLLVLGVLAGVFLIVVAWFLMSDDNSIADSDRDILNRDTPPGQESDPMNTTEGNAPLDPAEELSYYKMWAKYPPTTRPLHEGQLDLLEPFTLPRAAIPVIAKAAEGCRKVENKIECEKEAEFAEINCKLQPEASHSFGTGDFHVYLQCTDLKKNVAMPIDSIEAEVFHLEGRRLVKAPRPIGLGDKGEYGDKKAGDHIYTIQVRPTMNEWGPTYVRTTIKVNGLEHVQQVDWYSTPHKVAEFGTNIQDSKRDGSLVVSIPITVIKAGYYEIRANLQEKDGEKRMVASASIKERLSTGNHVVDLEFFGKVIRDSGVDGPYIVRNIRAFRDNGVMPADELKQHVVAGTTPEPREITEPAMEYVKPAGEHTTENYQALDFSAEEWQSAEKDKRIQFLESRL
ncbi:MAG: hypothetical protein KDK39_13300 [Leptospiraceae bacterium]|nr:hypothetical protein [Leptospiraceae bacterium]